MSKRIKLINQLDSLRAFAAFSVIIYHFLPSFHLGKFSFGWAGVDVFFVISGYLITAILLEQKNNISNKILIIKNFIIKRALRLFPTYYLLITFFLLLSIFFGLYVWRPGNAIYYFTYTQNFLVFAKGGQGTQVNHLWTLAVEEQFYLIWPWILIYVPNKWLIRALLIIIPFSLLFKSFSGFEYLRMLTFVHLDTLGGGALIALLLKEKGEQFFLQINKARMAIIFISLAILIFEAFYYVPYIFIVIATLILSSSLLIGCYYNFNGFFGRILNLPQLKYLGKISYGLYLYHQAVSYFLILFVFKMHLSIHGLILFFLSIILTIIVAHLSYNYIEKRFLNLKLKFDL